LCVCACGQESRPRLARRRGGNRVPGGE
jgi:hypothetical protein